ncbi:Glycyl-radical enzyme activating protein family [Candidatus Magnetomorum sp. HK-1]|nr:Glycyl-radical enzyme activating protein family [Candidatus Magnetomorum sp. HK-1]
MIKMICKVLLNKDCATVTNSIHKSSYSSSSALIPGSKDILPGVSKSGPFGVGFLIYQRKAIMPLHKQKINILEIKGNSLDDGPGIRTLIFFKGCPLSCVWCHNPESKSFQTQISFDPKVCIYCNDCINICKENALSRDNPFFIDRNLCTLCFQCVEDCPSEALTSVGKQLDIDDIILEIEKDMPFFQTSNGGVTFSGGEPTFQMDALSALAKTCKEKGINTLLETCGLFKWEDFQNKILPYMNIIYYDIKIMNTKAHEKYCGVDNQLILNNFEKLVSAISNTDVKLLPRTPLVPNITATTENIKAIANYVKKLNIPHLQLMEYNPLWLEKNFKIGVTNPYVQSKEMSQWMKQEDVKKFLSYV